jgi:hypothetical protein
MKTPRRNPATRSVSRRAFLRRGAFFSAGALGSVCAPSSAVAPAAGAASFPVIDYGRSFLVGQAPANQVRFWVESRTRMLDERSGRHEDFYQCASCKAESTFAEKELFLTDNYDFLPIFGPEDGVIFRRKAWLNPDYRTVKKAAQMWDGPRYDVRMPSSVQLLSDNDAIRRASHEGHAIVAQTELADSSTGLRAIIEFPVKTLNIHDERNLYQVDTGPIAFPDLSQRFGSFAEALSLAFIAFNAPHFADFVIEDVTPLKEADREVARVRHFERVVSLPAQNRLYALNAAEPR